MLSELITSKIKGVYNKLIFILGRSIADKGRAFSSAFKLSNVDIYIYIYVRLELSCVS